MDPGVAAPLAAGPSLARAGLMVAPAMAVANGLNYAFNLVMLRLLEPEAYGALGALLAVIPIGTVPGLALQAVVARHTALRAGDRRAVAELWSRTLVAVSWVSLGLGLAVAAAAPALAAFLHLGSIVPALWLAANILPLPLVSALQGMLQGVQRFGALAAALLLNAGARLAVGVGLVAAGHGVDGALAAAGAVVAKIAYWAPQFVATIVFPRLATEAAARRRLLARAAAAITALGVALMVVVAAAPELAVTLPFGAAYRDVGPDLPLFAALGTALALVQLLLFSGIAAGDRKVHRLLGATVVIEVAVIALGPHHSVTGIVGAALAAVTALLGACWVLERRRQPVEAAP